MKSTYYERQKRKSKHETNQRPAVATYLCCRFANIFAQNKLTHRLQQLSIIASIKSILFLIIIELVRVYSRAMRKATIRTMVYSVNSRSSSGGGARTNSRNKIYSSASIYCFYWHRAYWKTEAQQTRQSPHRLGAVPCRAIDHLSLATSVLRSWNIIAVFSITVRSVRVR